MTNNCKRYGEDKIDKSLVLVRKQKKFGITLCMHDVNCQTYFVSLGYILHSVHEQGQNRCFCDTQLQRYGEDKIDKSLYLVQKMKKFGVILCTHDPS